MAGVRAQCDALLRARARRGRKLAVAVALRQDLRFGWQSLSRPPGFAIVAVLSLALSIGANTTIFGLMHSLLLARLPAPDARKLIQLLGRERCLTSAEALAPELSAEMSNEPTFFSHDQFVTLRSSKTLELAAYTSTTLSADRRASGS